MIDSKNVDHNVILGQTKCAYDPIIPATAFAPLERKIASPYVIIAATATGGTERADSTRHNQRLGPSFSTHSCMHFHGSTVCRLSG